MSRTYYNRYDEFTVDGEFKIVPGIEIPIKKTDKYIIYKKIRTGWTNYHLSIMDHHYLGG